MGLTKLTRYELFMNVVEILEQQQENIDMFTNKSEIKNMYYHSAIIIEGMEEVINDSIEMIKEYSFEELINRNLNRMNDSSFANIIRNGIEIQIQEWEKKNKKIVFKDYFRFLLKTLTEYQNEMIDKCFIRMKDVTNVRGYRKQTFLSYAYLDKGLTLALYYFFKVNGGFLYVNWMWEGTNESSKVTKQELEKALCDSNQFLFLRTTNSEFHVRGNNSIRQWCSWEIGFYYSKNQHEKYYTSFYDKQPTRNDLLDSFSIMTDVVNGQVVS